MEEGGLRPRNVGGDIMLIFKSSPKCGDCGDALAGVSILSFGVVGRLLIFRSPPSAPANVRKQVAWND